MASTVPDEVSVEEYFVGLHKPYVQKDFLKFYQEELPIWGRILRHISLRPEANEIIGTDEELFEFLSPYFTEYVLDRIKASLLHSETSSFGPCGAAYVKRGVYSTFCQRLIDAIVEETEETEEESETEEEAETEDEAEVTQRTKKQKVEKMLIHSDEPPALGNRRLVGARPTSAGIGQARFQLAHPIVVDVGMFDTPPKDVGTVEETKRVTLIRERSAQFSAAVKQQYIDQDGVLRLPGPEYLGHGTPVPEYEPREHSSTSKVYLFHGTRMRHLNDFSTNGIRTTVHKSDFSAGGRVFYVSNSFEYAFEHVLLNVFNEEKAKEKETGAPTTVNSHRDFVAVYCFGVPCGELEGDVTIPQIGDMFTTEFYPYPEAREKWLRFVKDNNASDGKGIPDGLPSTADIIMGPIGVPEWTVLPPAAAPGKSRKERIRKTYTHVKKEDEDTIPLQLAFLTSRAWAWLSDYVECVFIENRHD